MGNACCAAIGQYCSNLDGEKLARLLRYTSMATAVLVIACAVFAFVINVQAMARLSDCEDCGDQTLWVEQALGCFSIQLLLFSLGVAILLAEVHAPCIARYLGFLSFRLGRGCSLVVIGVVNYTYSAAFVKAMEKTPDVGDNAHMFESVSGIVAASVGLVTIVLCLLPKECCSLALPPDDLTTHFRDNQRAATNARRTDPSPNSSCASSPSGGNNSAYGSACGGGGSGGSSTRGDVELGGGGEADDEKKSKSRLGRSKSAKKKGEPGGGAPPPVVSIVPGAGADGPGGAAANDNPFVGRRVDDRLSSGAEVNPFMGGSKI